MSVTCEIADVVVDIAEQIALRSVPGGGELGAGSSTASSCRSIGARNLVPSWRTTSGALDVTLDDDAQLARLDEVSADRTGVPPRFPGLGANPRHRVRGHVRSDRQPPGEALRGLTPPESSGRYQSPAVGSASSALDVGAHHVEM